MIFIWEDMNITGLTILQSIALYEKWISELSIAIISKLVTRPRAKPPFNTVSDTNVLREYAKAYHEPLL